MRRPEIIGISENFIPEHSNADTAAEVMLGDGTKTVIELFEGTPSSEGLRIVEFRGLPEHLDGGRFYVKITRGLGQSAHRFNEPEQSARETSLLIKFAIGAAQELWDGAEAMYEDKSYDPTSPFYDIRGFLERSR